MDGRLTREVEALLRWVERGGVAPVSRGPVPGARSVGLPLGSGFPLPPNILMSHGWYRYADKLVTPPGGAPANFPGDFPEALPEAVPFDASCIFAPIDIEAHESPFPRLDLYDRTAQYTGLARLADQALRGVGRSFERLLWDHPTWNPQDRSIGLVRLPDKSFWAVRLRETRTGTAPSATLLAVPEEAHCLVPLIDSPTYALGKRRLLLAYLLAMLAPATDALGNWIVKPLGDCSGVIDYIAELFGPSDKPWASLGWGWCWSPQMPGTAGQDDAAGLIVVHRYTDLGQGYVSLEWRLARIAFSVPEVGAGCVGIEMSDPAEDMEQGWFPPVLNGWHRFIIMSLQFLNNGDYRGRGLWNVAVKVPEGLVPEPEARGVCAACYAPDGEEALVELLGKVQGRTGGAMPEASIGGLALGESVTRTGVPGSGGERQTLAVFGDSIPCPAPSESFSGTYTVTATDGYEIFDSGRWIWSATRFSGSYSSASSSTFRVDCGNDVFIDNRWPGVVWRIWDAGEGWASDECGWTGESDYGDGSALGFFADKIVCDQSGGESHDDRFSVHVDGERYDVSATQALHATLVSVADDVGSSLIPVAVPTGPWAAVGYYGRLAVDGAYADAPEGYAEARHSGWVGAS